MEQINFIISSVQFWLGDFLRRFELFLGDTLSNTVNWLNEQIFVVLQGIDSLILTTTVALDSMTQAVTSAVTGLVDVMRSAVDRLWAQVTEATVKVLDTIAEYVSSTTSQVTAFIGTALDTITSLVNRVVVGVQTLIDTALLLIKGFADSLALAVTDFLAEQIKRGGDLFDVLTLNIGEGIDALIGASDSLISGIGERLGDVKDAFADAATNLVENLTGISEDTFNPIRDTIKDLFADIVENASPGETQAQTAFIAEKLASGSPQDLASMGIQGWVKFAPFKSKFWSGVFFFLISILSLFPMLVSVTTAQSEVLLHGFRQQFPYLLLGPADVTGAWRRGLISEAEAVDTITKGGYTAEQAQQILKLSSIVPEGQELLTLVNRGFVSEEAAQGALFERGLKPEFVGPFMELRNVLPPVQDIITMAVREVFNPAVVARFGQNEDFPEEFADEAAKQGLSRDWAVKYWAAHWSLPSPRQGFEMLHRGAIQDADLDLLLKSLDIMPFWRDSLKKIAFTPFTRVDIRRMHKVGVLSDADVLRAYKDIGYDAEKAAIQTDFVKRLSANAGAEDDAELGKLTRASILGFFQDGLLTRERAKGLLELSGHTPQAADLYLDVQELDTERKERKLEVDLAIDLAKAGTITFEEAQDRLAKIGMSDLEVKKAINKLLKAEESKTKLPSRTEAERMVLAGLITTEDYAEVLSRQGYALKWRTAFVNLLGQKVIEDANKA